MTTAVKLEWTRAIPGRRTNPNGLSLWSDCSLASCREKIGPTPREGPKIATAVMAMRRISMPVLTHHPGGE